MTVTFFTNLVNHHQIPLADEFYNILGDDYKLVSTMPVPESLVKGGYDQYIERPYIIRSYEDDEKYAEALKLMEESDVVISSSGFQSEVCERKKNNKLTFHYAERWNKKAGWHIFDPRRLHYIYKNYFRFRNKQTFLLCASAFASKDANFYGCFKNKCYKFGYFPSVTMPEGAQHIYSKDAEPVKLMWCSRFLEWKHPELPIKLALELKKKGYSFKMDIFGSGELFDEIVSLSSYLGVDKLISFYGNKPNRQILDEMRNHDIFLFTSDREEGWGAVLNEAMANGCTVIASDEVGAAPFLINDGVNGMLFKTKNLNSLVEKTEYAITHREESRIMAARAISTMDEEWSPKTAADRFISLSSSLLNKSGVEFLEGPCSMV